jgi:hypothetical protein
MAEVQQSAVILVNGFDLSQYLKMIEDTAEVDMLDNTNFTTDGARTFQPGLNTRKISGEGFFAYDSSTDAQSIDKLFADAFDSSAQRLISFCQQGAITAGDIAVMMNTKQAAYGVQETVGEILMTTFEALATSDASSARYARGLWILNQVFTGSANGASYDNAAGSTGYFCHVHNTDADGTATVKVQHSTNNSLWVDLIDFSTVAQNGAEQAVSTSASVNRYVRAIVTAIGGTTATVSVAIKLGYTGV